MERMRLPFGTRKTMKALIEVVQPKGGIFDLDLQDYMLEFTEQMLLHLPRDTKFLFPIGLLLLEYGTLPFMGWVTPFSRLSLEDRDTYIHNWVNSRLMIRRELIKGVKALAVLGYFEHPENKKKLDFMSDAYIEAVGEERLERYGPEIRAIQSRTS